MNISFSLYGNHDKYIIGAYKNIELCNQLVPKYQITIFTNNKVTSQKYIDKLLNNTNVIIIDPENILPDYDVYKFPMFWRFFAFFEDSPSLSRDLDSRISNREIQYITKWNKNQEIFIIRDHPWQSSVPGGLIGMQNISSLFYQFFVDFIETRNTGWGDDQIMLNEFVELYKNTLNIYKCEKESNNYIPRDNKNFFIGIQLDENDQPLCPESLSYLDHLNL